MESVTSLAKQETVTYTHAVYGTPPADLGMMFIPFLAAMFSQPLHFTHSILS